MKTILILAEALQKAAPNTEILRLDMQYNEKEEMFHGYLFLGSFEFDICETGEIKKLK